MTIHEVIDALEANVVTEGDLGQTILTACGSDMMSDVLAFVKDQSMLLTGLVNPQVIRTAEMLDMRCVVFVRGKEPTEAMVQLAQERDMTLLTTRYRMFTACGRLYARGLGGGCDEV